jgi:hypothetical protein
MDFIAKLKEELVSEITHEVMENIYKQFDVYVNTIIEKVKNARMQVNTNTITNTITTIKPETEEAVKKLPIIYTFTSRHDWPNLYNNTEAYKIFKKWYDGDNAENQDFKCPRHAFNFLCKYEKSITIELNSDGTATMTTSDNVHRII